METIYVVGCAAIGLAVLGGLTFAQNPLRISTIKLYRKIGFAIGLFATFAGLLLGINVAADETGENWWYLLAGYTAIPAMLFFATATLVNTIVGGHAFDPDYDMFKGYRKVDKR